MNTYNELKYKVFNSGSKVNLFIGINVIVFLMLSIISLVSLLFFKQGGIDLFTYEYLGVPANLHSLLYRFWTPFTYMFVHEGIWHILFNMLWLFWMGKIFEGFQNPKKLTFLYILGGISGAAFYIICYNLIPAFKDSAPTSIAVGSSAAVSAIVIATATLLPNYSIQLLLFGSVKLKWLALVFIIIDVISLAGSNAGGHLSHLGGALFGFFYIKSLQNGKDWSKVFENVFKPRKKLKIVSKNFDVESPSNNDQLPNQETVDAILDKISQSGYNSLSKKEKNTLFRASRGNEEE
ncbi:Rhomboid family protein [Pseudopedobacter saltans DSM 12145]|uniref:Rhomboid family protein n=1 Tax=Pseudopedobacter saltans (strain ATCC 51119 / DSM 12145 / JCM 21818 / CCUG 39354 / LMG 10337 / NBRC 100064 / NCIMB 13643) TaxID=762903 RepID=F0SE59_PSESL|nr:rhomboid family intramembrane serine protease [Pseudopedobacter saltans]ADY53981.1 Rhomboid family protein [Pseudopedobacter saltans DSM 12145]